MKNKDYSHLYKILEVKPGTSLEEITKSYQRLIEKYHPDKAGHSRENFERFHEILEAYTELRVRIRTRGEIKIREEEDVSSKKESLLSGWRKGSNIVNRLSSIFGKVFQRESERDFIFQRYVDEIGKTFGLDLFAVCSIKGGIGKSLVSNSLAVTLALTMRYISMIMKKETQKVELIDLDFGKPDQRFLSGVEPEYFIEDLFSRKDKKIDWDMLKTGTPINNLKVISSSPSKASQGLFYEHRNRLLYYLNESDAQIKIIDFGGGLSSNLLYFLRNIKNKVLITTGERSSIEAFYHLALTLLANQILKAFCDDERIKKLTDKLINCFKNNYTVKKMIVDLESIDNERIKPENVDKFYKKELLPLQKEFENIQASTVSTYSELIEEIEKTENLIENEIEKFSGIGKDSQLIARKLKRYLSILMRIKKRADRFNPHKSRLIDILKNYKLGLIVNMCNEKRGKEVAEEIRNRLFHYTGYSIRYFGNISEDHSLRGISNSRIPYIIRKPKSEASFCFYRISDNILNLKKNITASVIKNQLDYIDELRYKWSNSFKH